MRESEIAAGYSGELRNQYLRILTSKFQNDSVGEVLRFSVVIFVFFFSLCGVYRIKHDVAIKSYIRCELGVFPRGKKNERLHRTV